MTIRITIDRVTCLPASLRQEVLQIKLATSNSDGIKRLDEGDWQATVWKDRVWVAAQQIFETTVYVGGKPVPVAGLSQPITKPEQRNQGYGTRAFTAAMAFMHQQFTCNYAMMFSVDKQCYLFEQLDWHLLTTAVTCQQPNGSYPLSDDSYTLVYCLTETPWPTGSVHLRSLPW